MFAHHANSSELQHLLICILLEDIFRLRVPLEKSIKVLFADGIEQNLIACFRICLGSVMMITENDFKFSFLKYLLVEISIFIFADAVLFGLASSVVEGKLIIHHGLINIQRGALPVNHNRFLKLSVFTHHY